MGAPYIGLHDANGTQLLPLLVEPASDAILVEKFEIDAAAARDQASNRILASGTTDRTTYHGAAAVTVEGTFVGDATGTPWSYAEQLQRLSRPSSRVYFHVQRADWDTPRRILVRGKQPTVTYSDLQPGFQFQYVAPDGVLESLTEQHAVVFPLSDAIEGGVAEPVFEPVGTNPSGSAGGLQLQVDGTENCLPVVDLYGPCTGLVTITLADSGQIWQSKPSLQVDAGHFLRIDFADHTMHVDGDPSLSRFGFLDFAGTDWWALPPGQAEVALYVQFPGAGCHAVLRWRPRWMP